MIEKETSDNFILSDGQILSVTCNFNDRMIEVKLQVRKRLAKRIVPCVVCLRFEEVTEFNVLEDFGTSGNYSDVVLSRLPEGRFYASFDPYGNSGEPNEKDNFVIKAAGWKMEELSII